jgi:hypothetical protein
MAARGFLRPGCINGGADRDSEKEGSFLVSAGNCTSNSRASHLQTQVFNENGGMPIPQQRRRLPIFGNRSEFLYVIFPAFSNVKC